MKPGAEFELKCYRYLKDHYTTKNTTFLHEGGMNSTKSDIVAIKNGKVDFYIEAKDALAQSGQFVVLRNDATETYLFSPRNKSTPNEMTEIIINYMNQNFHYFKNAGTKGAPLNIDSKIFADWIIEHYQNKQVKYVISYKQDYIIFPIRKFQKYFKISANYRKKKSGSRKPAKKDLENIKQLIQTYYSTSVFTQTNGKLFVSISEPITQTKFPFDNYTYYLSEQYPGKYEVRKLSNTQNMNVIFSVELNNIQDDVDLDEFIKDL